MAQGAEFPLRKPPGFHYDFFLLGVTTFIAGLLGLPAPNGLIPQAPIHTASLLVMGRPVKEDEERTSSRTSTSRSPGPSRLQSQTNTMTIEPVDVGEKQKQARTEPVHPDWVPEVPVAIVEQRVSNLAQGSLCLVLLTGPFLHVLNLIPRGTKLNTGYSLLLTCVLPNRRCSRWTIVSYFHLQATSH